MRLETSGLRVGYGPTEVLHGIDLTVADGTVACVLGPNGAGKSTLLNTIAGSLRPRRGSVRIDSAAVAHYSSVALARRRVALVPEGRRLFAQMTVEENLVLGRMAGRAGPWTLAKIFEAFPNLEARRAARAGTLSGGEQQATAIGRALMSNPSLLLLDEVSLGLSPIAVERLYESLQALMQSGTTILLVEQDLGRAMAVASRVVCMLEGRVVLDGPTEAMPRQKVTEAYFGVGRTEVMA